MKTDKLLLLLLSSLLVACGQPGPLYLPTKPAPVPVKSEPVTKPEPAKNK